VALLYTVLITAQLISALATIALVLLQQGKGADMGAAFGSGSAGSFFGASGSANFLSRTTAITATIFFSSTLGLAYINGLPLKNSETFQEGGVMESIPFDSSSDPQKESLDGNVPAVIENVPSE
jgi:preprotein translocase subunit SecG